MIRDELRSRIFAFNQRRAEETTALSELSTLRQRFEALRNTGHWSEIDNGASISVGTRVRYFSRTYECKKSHDKSLLRSPSHNEYWEEIED